MNTRILFTLLLSTTWCTASVNDQVEDIYLVFSPYYSQADREKAQKTVNDLLSVAKPGTSIQCFDGQARQTIANFTIPKLVKDTPANRRRLLAGPIAKLVAWFDSLGRTPVPPEVRNTATLPIPAAIELISSTQPARARSVLLLCSPMPLYPTEPELSMDQFKFPSPAHLKETSVVTPYGVSDRSNTLNQTTVHLCYPSDNIWSNDFHRVCVTTWWARWTAAQGGVLASFSPDLAGILSVIQRKDLPSVRYAISDPNDTKVEMRTALARELRDRVLSTVEPEVNPPAVAEAPRTSQSPISLPITPAVGSIGIGIMWAQENDLDLYVQPSPSSEELFFQKTATKEGIYVHDYRSSNDRQDFEWVELRPPLDIRSLKAWVNFFEGHTVPVAGRVCVHYEGKTYLGDFAIKAPGGNRGASRQKRKDSPHWVELDIAGLIAGSQAVR